MGWKKLAKTFHAFLSFIVFTVLDFLDSFFCIVYAFLDEFFEGTASPCYCLKKEHDERKSEISETLYGRQNVFRKMGLLRLRRKPHESKEQVERTNRWSDCGCDSCVSWMKNGNDLKLHVVVQEPEASPANIKDFEERFPENIIFLHGFMSSSSFWTETVFSCLSENSKKKCRLFAVDLLGFGRSPKPRDCLYTLADHVEMIEKSVVFPFKLDSFHLVAHSMGSIIAIALAAKHPQIVKSITLVAPPYFPSSKDGASLLALQKLAERRLWPLLTFGSSFMSWYEHLGRTICFIVCRNHRIWEWLLRVLTKRDLHFMITDLTRHTHHSAWQTMHNVICGGAKLMDEYLEILCGSGAKTTIIQGGEDQVVPLECTNSIKMKVTEADVRIIPNADHSSVVLHQTKELTKDLESIWMSCS